MTDALALVIFDVDGTLVDSQAHILASMEGAFAAANRPAPPREQILGIVGLSLPVAISRLAPDLGETELALWVARYKEAFGALARSAGSAEANPLYPGVRDVLDRLAEVDGLLLGLATGKSRRGLDHVLAIHGLERHFVTRQVADDHPSKPHPSMLQAALAEIGVEAARALFVGDTTHDIEMGRAAGVPSIGVSWGYHPVDRLSRAGAVSVVEDFAEVERAALALLEGP